MKKISLVLVFCMVFVLLSSAFSYAESNDTNVLESPLVKIVIDGKAGSYTKVPINVNDRILLPLREVLNNLGVPNDNEHIYWNDADQSVTIKYNSNTVVFKIGGKTVKVNGVDVPVDVTPVLYKDSTYIPVRALSEGLGKKVVWDDKTQSVLVRDAGDFKKVKDILDTSDVAMNQIKKLKMNMDAVLKVLQSGFSMDIKMAMLGEMDMDKKAEHLALSISVPFMGNMDTETYIYGGTQYDKDITTKKWSKQILTAEEIKANFGSIGETISNDAAAASLVLADNADSNDIVLKGNMYLDDMINQLGKTSGVGDFKIDSVYTEIHIDKSTNLITKLDMKMNGSVEALSSSQKVSADITLTFSDYNGTFEIKVPDDVIQNAVSK